MPIKVRGVPRGGLPAGCSMPLTVHGHCPISAIGSGGVGLSMQAAPARELRQLARSSLKSYVMPFFQRKPFTHAEATYVWTGLGQPGFFQVSVQGNAPKVSSGFQLRRDPTFVGGLAVEVMGWTGPLIDPPQTTPYSVTGKFNGTFLKEIIVIGSNKIEVVHVKEIPFATDEEFMKLLSSA